MWVHGEGKCSIPVGSYPAPHFVTRKCGDRAYVILTVISMRPAGLPLMVMSKNTTGLDMVDYV